MDTKGVVSNHAMTQYLTKYVTKSEPRSAALGEILVEISRLLQSTEEAGRALVRLGMKFTGQRDISAQEVMHYNLGLDGFHCSRFAFVSFFRSLIVQDLHSSGF